MPRMKKSTNTQALREPFAAVAQRLGDALADVILHPGCPQEVADAIGELDTMIFNRHPDVVISLRHSFPHRLVGMLEQPA